jgi:hypothetical protein
MNMNASPEGEDLEEKKLLGSGGYAFDKLTEQEEVLNEERCVILVCCFFFVISNRILPS